MDTLATTPKTPRTPGSARKRSSAFKLELPGDDSVSSRIREKMSIVKERYRARDQRLNNTDVIERALDLLIASDCTESVGFNAMDIPAYDGNHVHFLCTDSAITGLLNSVQHHNALCQRQLLYRQDQILICGTVAAFHLSCSSGHSLSWNSSAYMPNGTFLSNALWTHACFSTGLLSNQITRLQDGLGFIPLRDDYQRDLTSKFSRAVCETKDFVCDSALREEIGMSIETDGNISILTDARHGCRRNAKDTNVVCIGHLTHKIIREEHITKADDPCTQRHELLGTRRLFQFFDSDIESIGGPVSIHSIAHDRNASVNKFIREERPDTRNQNDTWHAAKSVEKEISRVARGPKKHHGHSWHEQLVDKVQSIRTHVQYSMRNCEQDPNILRERLDNILAHYRNEHSNCPEESRCRVDPNYEPSKIVISDPVAEKLLRDAIHRTIVYKSPEDYVYAMDTYYVESFNNTLNMFHDKRIHFGDDSYDMRTGLAICHWNENVDRHSTGTYHYPSGKTKKILGPRTFHYRDAIWRRFLMQLSDGN